MQQTENQFYYQIVNNSEKFYIIKIYIKRETQSIGHIFILWLRK